MLVTSSALITNQKGIDYMSKYNTNNRHYKAMCERVGRDFREWLIDKYWDEKMTSRQLSEMAYGNSKNSPNITNWMAKLGVERRSRSEAVALQWVDNDERRAETAERLIKNTGAGTPGREKLINIMQTDEYKSKSSIAKMGPSNPMWDSDKTDEEREREKIHSRRFPGYKDFRRKVYERDNYACQTCGDNKGNNLVVHHINGFKWDVRNRLEVDNGVTLCTLCHNEFHRMYGRKDVNLFQFSQFLEYKQQALNN